MLTDTADRFDAIIIGVGQAGKPLALALAREGRKTAIIERKDVGGSCVNFGCTPTKTLIASAQVAHQARRSAEYGIETGAVRVDFKAVMERKNRLVEKSRDGTTESLTTTEHLTFIRGEARFDGPKTVVIALADGGEQTLTADQIFINCGTHSAKPDLPGIDTVPLLTASSLLSATELPPHLLILGGGYIGVEFSQLFRRLGSEVTIIERGPHLLDREDEDIVAELTKILTDEGVQVLNETTVELVAPDPTGGVMLTLKTAQGTNQVRGTHLLVATGTTPNTAALNLESAGVEVDEKGLIQVNDRLETSQPGIFALGDVKGGPAFTHIAYDDYRVVKRNLLGDGKGAITGRAVPYTIFTEPQLGRVGVSEREAREQGLAIKIASLPMEKVARAAEMSQTGGLMKVVIDANTDQILGASMLGVEGGELMSMIQIAMMGKLTYLQLRDAVLAHPTLAESFNNLFANVE